MTLLETERLILRPWKESDRAPFIAMNADPKVMEFFFAPMTKDQTIWFVEKIEEDFAEKGYGLFATELKATGEFIGFIGLKDAPAVLSFAPATEIAWRLAYPYWGNGYATEGAKQAIDFGFNTLGLEEIVSFTAAINKRSWRVMEKIGMKRNEEEDFLYPAMPPDHKVTPHVLYRLKRSEA